MWTCFVLQNWLIKEARKTSHYFTLTGCLTVCELYRRIFWDLWGGNQQHSAQLWSQKVSLDFTIAYLGCVWSVQLRQSKIYKVIWAFDSKGISFQYHSLVAQHISVLPFQLMSVVCSRTSAKLFGHHCFLQRPFTVCLLLRMQVVGRFSFEWAYLGSMFQCVSA